ncbi:MAG: FHA domain-containing protein [Victivallales bacterium]|nr:FHA domain-containing protein [Victivallales bacterium]
MAGTPKLIVLSEQLRGKSFELTKDLYTVGRSEERDICIKDPTISTYHCEFIRNGDAYILRDNNSTNGTRVNNVPVTEQALQNSDIIQLGGVELLYDRDDKSVTTVMRTQTGIDLESAEVGVATTRNMEDFELISSRKLTPTQMTLIGVVVLLVIAILGLLIWIGVLLTGKSSAGTATSTSVKQSVFSRLA